MTARFPNLGRATKYIKFIACHRQSVSTGCSIKLVTMVTMLTFS